VTGNPEWRPPDSVVDGATWAFHFAGSTVTGEETPKSEYDAATKTCTNVACHIKRSFGTLSGSTQDPLRWGRDPPGFAGCEDSCHQYN